MFTFSIGNKIPTCKKTGHFDVFFFFLKRSAWKNENINN